MKSNIWMLAMLTGALFTFLSSILMVVIPQMAYFALSSFAVAAISFIMMLITQALKTKKKAEK